MHIDLTQLARQTMLEKGLQPDFSKEEMAELAQIDQPAPLGSTKENLRSLLWCSIDNDDSLDLDQLTYAEKRGDGYTLWVAVADVDAVVKKDSPIDAHAQINTTSVYTPTKIFPMLPEKLSTNLTSLNEGVDRVAIVIKVQINQAGDIADYSISQAVVHNFAKLAYSSVGAWLEGKGAPPDKVKQVKGLEENLQLQSEVAQVLRQRRHAAGSLTLESSEAEAKMAGEQISMELPPHNLAHQLIEEFMIAANRAIAGTKVTHLRRVVRIPKNWPRIVEVAASYGEALPPKPDSKALDAFLVERQKADPVSFPDLSLTIIKLLGRGEYIVEGDQSKPVGHFALAISNYTHFTAPNRRFPDLISQRLYKAFLQKETPPYSLSELFRLADHCTKQEDAATKVERQMNKSAAAMLLSRQIGQTFKGIITGSGEKGTWVRIFHPAVEGKVIQGYKKLKVGDKVTVQLKFVDIAKGYIDFSH